jgi:predicted deacylase
MFTLHFETGNAAFEDAPETEIARILRAVADRIDAGEHLAKIHDVNGNRIGEFFFDAPLQCDDDE